MQADIRVISALGGYPVAVPTAITVQSSMGVQDVHPLSPELIRQQLLAVLGDAPIQAIKIGMLATAPIVNTVASTLRPFLLGHQNVPVILDPIMLSTSGHELLSEQGRRDLLAHLLPLATLITPNLPEFECLKRIEPAFIDKFRSDDCRIPIEGGHACRIPAESGHACRVLVKGGHADATDTLYIYTRTRDGIIGKPEATFAPSAFVQTRNTHGTGCTLSSAIATLMAQGLTLREAIAQAKEFLTRALRQGVDDARWPGHGPAFISLD